MMAVTKHALSHGTVDIDGVEHEVVEWKSRHYGDIVEAAAGFPYVLEETTAICYDISARCRNPATGRIVEIDLRLLAPRRQIKH